METFADLVRKKSPSWELCHSSEKVPKLSDFCPVYAQSEALDLLPEHIPPEQIIAGYHHAMARESVPWSPERG